MSHYLVVNKKLQDYNKDSVSFLLESERGVYTTVRTFERQSIFHYVLHVKRLVYGCSVMIKDQLKEGEEIPEGLHPITDYDKFYKLVTEELKYGLSLSKSETEQKITILVTWKLPDKYDILIHYSNLPELALPPVSVEIMPGTRTHIKAKDSEWARYRRRIEEMKKNPKSTDCVLLDKDDKLNECTAANFFAIIDGKVHTGIQGVLYGTVMDTILLVCKEMGLEVVKSSPEFKDIHKFQEVFLSSTTRLLVPIDKLIHHDADCFFDSKNDVILEKVNDKITEYEFKPKLGIEINENVKKKLKEFSVKIE